MDKFSRIAVTFRQLLGLLAASLLLAPAPVRADSGVVVARTRKIADRLEAYARVEPIATIKLNAAQTGLITGLKVLPGESVQAGAVLGKLQGPAIEGMLAQRRAAVNSARAAQRAARQALIGERQKRAERLSTRQAVAQAKSVLAEAQARLASASAQLQTAQEEVMLKAPVAGTVLTLDAATGQRVQPGQPILTLQPTGALWLTARYYGAAAAAVRIGMSGRFTPADGSSAIPVRVRTRIGPVRPDGGQTFGLVPTESAPSWPNGEAGTVILQGAARTLPAVPTRALILYQGRWWVLVHLPHGTRRQAVIPGPSRGDSTLIEQGLKAGTEVVLENAYLEFHREFSQHYQPPD